MLINEVCKRCGLTKKAMDKTQIAGPARSKILNKIASADGRQRAELIQNIIDPSGQLTAAAVRKLYKLLIRL